MGLLAAAGPTFGALAAYTGQPSTAHFVWLGIMVLTLTGTAWCAELKPRKGSKRALLQKKPVNLPRFAGSLAW